MWNPKSFGFLCKFSVALVIPDLFQSFLFLGVRRDAAFGFPGWYSRGRWEPRGDGRPHGGGGR